LSYSPTDSLIGPIKAQIAQIISTQITGVSRVYSDAPDGPPENNSCVISPPTFKLTSDTLGKLCLKLTFPIRHVIRRKKMADDLMLVQQMSVPYLLALSAWRNQQLYNGTTNLARTISPTSGGVVQFIESNQVYIAFLINLDVDVDLNIDTSE
jgi:hypothetical protein